MDLEEGADIHALEHAAGSDNVDPVLFYFSTLFIFSLANLLLGRLTSPTQAAIGAERQLRFQEALNDMDPLHREVLALRHFEELSNNEAAAVLGQSKTAASNRYVRALRRLKEVLSGLPGIDPNASAE